VALAVGGYSLGRSTVKAAEATGAGSVLGESAEKLAKDKGEVKP